MIPFWSKVLIGMNKITPRWFNLISWSITFLLVLAAGGFAFWRMQNPQVVTAAPAPMATTSPQSAATPTGNTVSVLSLPALERNLTLKTIVPERPRYAVIKHTVERGDSVFAIAKAASVKPDSLLWANFDVLNDSPDSIRPGQELNLPPTDGILYQWKDGDTLEKIAAQYKAKVDDILNWPGNNLDLTNPSFKAGELVMIPGGWRESKAFVLPTITRGKGTGTAGTGGSACGAGGAVGGGGFIFPVANHFLSGNDYYGGHLGIDLAAAEGTPVYAADAGVVVKASGGYNGGYGNVVMIDHGNGFVTLYAHLSQINVSTCQSVGQGTVIGAAGNTGNSFGAHLHFEVRKGGGNINPWSVLGQ
jgi:murein DD-endopeptidase MepM/ murein hydrolase activator NlpD